MGLMTFLRNRAGFILIGAIGLAIVAFLVSDAINAGKPFWNASQKVVGEIDGHEVSIDEFGPKVDQSLQQFKQQYGGSANSQMTAMAVENVWNNEVANVLLGKEFERLGLTVTSTELFDLLQGKNPSPLIRQYFGNPQTGQVDRNAVISSLKARSKDANLNKQWSLLEEEVRKQALQQKYQNLIRSSVYVTNLEAADDFSNRNKLASFKYVSLDYATIADKDVKLTDADYNDYYNANKKRFENPAETRSFQYVNFSFKPSKEDTTAAKAQVDKLAADFKAAANDSLFAAINSDVKIPFSYISKGKLDPAVDSAVFSLPAGSFYGPVFSGNSYKLAKVVSTKQSPDSVKAAHILINPAKVGGNDKAVKLADSLKSLVQKGANFGDLARQYSEDGSKDQGGDLGTFARGAMVPEFENAAFDGSTGDLKVVTSQFGVHLIKIEKQVGSSKVAKIAYVEKNLAPSDKTQQEAYKKASNFLAEAKGDNFSTLAQKRGLTVGIADKITGSQGFAPGLDNPRKLIQDAYEADRGDVLPEIYTMSDGYVVAVLTEVRPKGTLALEAVKKDIEPMVRNEVKGKMLIGRFEKAGAGKATLEALAQKLGKAVQPVQNIVFSNPVIPGVAQENKVVGTVFGMQPGKVSGPIAGDRGVYAVSPLTFSNPAPGDPAQQKQTLLPGLAQRALSGAFMALQDKADIKDNRVKFY
nr:peptidylprolyl isomerase [Pedobacter sp. SYP-B3415]